MVDNCNRCLAKEKHQVWKDCPGAKHRCIHCKKVGHIDEKCFAFKRYDIYKNVGRTIQVMLIHGPPGSGKTSVIDSAEKYHIGNHRICSIKMDDYLQTPPELSEQSIRDAVLAGRDDMLTQLRLIISSFVSSNDDYANLVVLLEENAPQFSHRQYWLKELSKTKGKLSQLNDFTEICFSLVYMTADLDTLKTRVSHRTSNIVKEDTVMKQNQILSEHYDMYTSVDDDNTFKTLMADCNNPIERIHLNLEDDSLRTNKETSRIVQSGIDKVTYLFNTESITGDYSVAYFESFLTATLHEKEMYWLAVPPPPKEVVITPEITTVHHSEKIDLQRRQLVKVLVQNAPAGLKQNVAVICQDSKMSIVEWLRSAATEDQSVAKDNGTSTVEAEPKLMIIETDMLNFTIPVADLIQIPSKGVDQFLKRLFEQQKYE